MKVNYTYRDPDEMAVYKLSEAMFSLGIKLPPWRLYEYYRERRR